MGADWLQVAPPVQEALHAGQPVVALESTVIAHGLPYPHNLEAAQRIEQVVREHDAVPATIAILNGVPRVGLAEHELAHLAHSREVAKVSRRDLPLVVARRLDGATTVAATMVLAAAARIDVFCTGGIGGVHRGQPFDVSADLPELARSPVVVICAGPKAILDLPLTLEWLETHGVPVLGYGTDSLPAFYTRSSGLPVDARVDTPDQVADIVHAQRQLGLTGGLLVTVPVPLEDALPAELVEQTIQEALTAAAAAGIHGRETTPYLLARIGVLTGGRSVETNVALLEQNAAVAAQIAAALLS